MNIPPILKNKWVWIGGAGVFLVVVLVSGGGGGGGGSGVTASGPSDAEIAASRDITLATLNAQVQQNAQAGQIAQIQAQGQVELATMAMNAQLQQYAVDAQVAIQNLQVTSGRDIQLADIASQERRETYALNQNAQVARWTLDQATANAQIQADFQLDYAEAANTTTMFLSQMQAELTAQTIIANRDVTMAGLATQTNLAAIGANLQRDVTYSNNATQASIYAGMQNAQTEQMRIMQQAEIERTRLITSAQKKSSSNSLFGSIIGSIAGVIPFLSDPRVKTDIIPLGNRQDGLGIYAFHYIGGDTQYLGVMADEVELLRPDASGPLLLGTLRTVDYARLN